MKGDETMTVLLEDISQIRKALENNKLIIFVGAGVSANSNLPTWKELVNKFAKKLNIPINSISNDDFLKIAQYMFEANSELYYEIINGTLNIEAKSNPINDMILEILPNHIITTNYDKLLESSTNVNVNSYNVVSNDQELLTSSNDHYILKMHGDIENINQIVLKEDDYLNYSSDRILTETYIKSLLVDHTFLFIGYSLNDYNLKLIMSWIEFLSTKENVKDVRHKNFIFNANQVEDYEEKYWINKNLKIITGSKISEELLEKYSSNEITHIDGKKLYTFLRLIKEENAELELENLSSVLLQRYKSYQKVEFIYSHDLLNISGIKNYTLIDNQLLLHDEKIFLTWEKLLKENKIIKYWGKSGIRLVVLHGNNKVIKIDKSTENQNDCEVLTKLISFNYGEVSRLIETIEISENRKYYYKSQLNINSEEVENYFTRSMSSIGEGLSNWEIAILKYNQFLYRRTLNPFGSLKNESIKYVNFWMKNEKKAYQYLYNLIEKGKDFQKLEKIAELLIKVENIYDNPPAFTTEPYGNIFQIQNIVYEHFNFIKLNGILVDHFSETISLFEYYNKALLKTQTIIQDHAMDYGFGTRASIRNYEWNQLDIYVFVYYGVYKNMQSYILNNNIQNISLEKDIDIIELFADFSNSLLYTLDLGSDNLTKKFKNFTLMLSKVQLTDEQKKKLQIPILKLISDNTFLHYLEYNNETRYFMELLHLIINQGIKLNAIDLIMILYNLPQESFTSRLVLGFISEIKKKKMEIDVDDFEKRIEIVMSQLPNDATKLLWLKNIFPLLKEDFFISNLTILNNYIINLNIDLVIYLKELELLEQEVIQKLKDNYYRIIDNSQKFQENGASSIPDPIETSIAECIILYIHKVFKDLLFLEDKIELSDHLHFILEPSNFDYSKIEPRNYMWGNLFRHKQCLDNILLYGRNELKQIIGENIKLGVASENEKIIFYRYLVEDDEVWTMT